MNDPHYTTSRWLSWALRHDPVEAGIALDGEGWTAIDDLLAAANRAGQRLDRATLTELVASNAKQRFAISPDGTRIRANQGHSVQVDLGLVPQVPPAVLHHGTVARALPGILRDGLQRGSRHHVHLSADPGTATAVGARRGQPVVLRIDAAAMHAAGLLFYRSANGVWLADAVPAGYITVPEAERTGKERTT